MWSQLRDISIRVDEDAERGTPLNACKCYVLAQAHANAKRAKHSFRLVISLGIRQSSRMQTGRSLVYARNGGAAASQPLAVSAAISTLKEGGSFIDAAIALSAVICVVEPGASHLGGDAFLVTHHAASKTNLAFNGSGEASHASTPAAYVD